MGSMAMSSGAGVITLLIVFFSPALVTVKGLRFWLLAITAVTGRLVLIRPSHIKITLGTSTSIRLGTPGATRIVTMDTLFVLFGILPNSE